MFIVDHDYEKREKIIRSAFDSQTFEEDVSIRVERDVGSATISPSGRDVALASYVCPYLGRISTYSCLQLGWP